MNKHIILFQILREHKSLEKKKMIKKPIIPFQMLMYVLIPDIIIVKKGHTTEEDNVAKDIEKRKEIKEGT